MEYVTLNNGVKMPKIGFGVYQIKDQYECERIICDAIKVGYRLFDTAQRYGNEECLGKAIVKSGIPREEFFLTTKIWITNTSYDKALKSIYESMRKLQTNYLDLVLIHQPFGDYYSAYRALEKLYDEGIVKAIGVSNFFPDRLVDLIKFQKVIPQVNQIETHPFYQQKDALKYMKMYGVQHESWSPFAEGKKDLFSNANLKKIGAKYQKSVAQVVLRYFLQKDIVVIPKSTNKKRMAENLQVFDFQLSEEDMDIIWKMDENKSLFFDHHDPKLLDRFLN